MIVIAMIGSVFSPACEDGPATTHEPSISLVEIEYNQAFYNLENSKLKNLHCYTSTNQINCKVLTMGENVLPIKERIYIGGLDPPRLSSTDVLRRLKAVKGIEIESVTCCNNKDNDDDDDSDDDSYINENDNKPYLHVTAVSKDEDLTALSIISKQYHNVKWKGCKLVVEAAKPHFLERLREERKVKDEALATSTAIECNTIASEDGVITTEEKQEQQLSNNITTTATTGLIPRRLKVRKKHGHAAFHVDTQPWSVDNWFFFNKARDKLEDRVEKYHTDTIINNKKPPHARLVAKPLMHRAVHIRFQDKVKSVSQNKNPNNSSSGTDDITSHEVKKNDDNESSSIISSSDSDSDSSNEYGEKERENVLQEVSVSMNVKEKEVKVDKYHWSSSEDESSDDDDDEEEYSNFRPPLKNNSLLSSVEISGTDEFAAGFDDTSSFDENIEDGQLEDTESSDNYDQSGDSNIESGLVGDVSSNLNILSSIFPDMVDAKPVNPSSEHDPNLDNPNITSSTNKSKSVPNGIMPRFDPNAKSSEQYIVEKLPTEQDGSDISPTNESSCKNNSDDDASVEDECGDDNVTGEKPKNPAEYEVDTTPALTQDGVYDQDKLENVFRDARDGWEGQDTRTTLVNDTPTRTNPDSSSGTGAFSFGFNLSDNDNANKQKVIEKNPTKDNTFSFSFDVPVSVPVPVQAQVDSTTINIPTEKEKDLEYTNASISSRAEIDTTDDGKNTDSDTVVLPRRRGINLPEQDLKRYVDNFFGCNNGLYIMRNVDGFKKDDRERAEWNRERQSLTLDWKRKRKYAINRIQKRMKTKRR
jgi:hypothetical protein